VIQPEAVRPATPIIRPRQMPLAEPEEELELTEIAEPAPAPFAPSPHKQMITAPPPAAPQASPEPAPAAQGKSFASLFGWKSKPAEGPAVAAPQPKSAEEDMFDDELEIPAFLRRSGNA
jgi:hypothetical protein